MKILQINKFFYRNGGADIHFLDLCHVLESKSHEVIHFSTEDPANESSLYCRYFVKHIEMRQHRGFWDSLKVVGHILYSTEAVQKLEALIKDTQPEIAHLHNIYHHLSPSILPVLKKHRIPIVMTLHDYKLICPNYRLFTQGKICEQCKKHKYYQAVFHRCIFNQVLPSAAVALEMSFHKIWGIYEKNIDVFISPSRFLKNKMGEWGIKNRIEVLPNFVKEQRTKNKEQIVGDYLLYFGRLSEEKGLLTLLEAMKKLPEIKLRIVGVGPLKERLINNVAMRQCENVAIVGYKSNRELEAEIAGAKAVVLPSEWYENYPLSVLEAMSYGKPVIAARIGGLPEIVRDGESGLLFKAGSAEDLAEKIKIIWSGAGLAGKLGRQAREQVVSENHPEKYYQRLMEIYQGLIRV